MANLKEIAEVAWRQVFPNPGDETPISVEEFIVTAKSEYALQMQLYYWAEKQREGEFVMPSHLLVEKEMDVEEDEIDISKLSVFRNLSSDIWLQNVGGLQCKCRYVKSNVNLTQLLCDDDSLGTDVRTFLVVGKKIKFPQGTHAAKITLIYASQGEDLDDDIEVDEAIGGIVRTRLVEIYLGKVAKEDVTNNTNGNG